MSYQSWSQSQQLHNSQEWSQSQDSGLDSGSDFSQPAAPAFAGLPPSFAGRRTLARPPSCPDNDGAGVAESSSGRWKFSRVSNNSQDISESQILRDLQQHLEDLDDVVEENSQKMSTIVKGSIKVCQSLMKDEGEDILEDVKKISDKLAKEQQEKLAEKVNNIHDLVKESRDMISRADAQHKLILGRLEALVGDQIETKHGQALLPPVRLQYSSKIRHEDDDNEEREESVSLLANES